MTRHNCTVAITYIHTKRTVTEERPWKCQQKKLIVGEVTKELKLVLLDQNFVRDSDAAKIILRRVP